MGLGANSSAGTEAAATALTTLPLSTSILITVLAIFVKVEKIAVRFGSSNVCVESEGL